MGWRRVSVQPRCKRKLRPIEEKGENIQVFREKCNAKRVGTAARGGDDESARARAQRMAKAGVKPSAKPTGGKGPKSSKDADSPNAKSMGDDVDDTLSHPPKNKEQVLRRVNFSGLPTTSDVQDAVMQLLALKYEQLVKIFAHYCKMSDCKSVKIATTLTLSKHGSTLRARSRRRLAACRRAARSDGAALAQRLYYETGGARHATTLALAGATPRTILHAGVCCGPTIAAVRCHREVPVRLPRTQLCFARAPRAARSVLA